MHETGVAACGMKIKCGHAIGVHEAYSLIGVHEEKYESGYRSPSKSNRSVFVPTFPSFTLLNIS